MPRTTSSCRGRNPSFRFPLSSSPDGGLEGLLLAGITRCKWQRFSPIEERESASFKTATLIITDSNNCGAREDYKVLRKFSYFLNGWRISPRKRSRKKNLKDKQPKAVLRRGNLRQQSLRKENSVSRVP